MYPLNLWFDSFPWSEFPSEYFHFFIYEGVAWLAESDDLSVLSVWVFEDAEFGLMADVALVTFHWFT